MRPRCFFLLAGLGVAILSGEVRAATPGDPLEKMNRRFYAGAEAADRKYVRPLARFYRKLTPGPIGEGLHNFVTYLSEPAVIANDLLQARFGHAGADLARLVTNSILGGFVDFAKGEGLPHHDNDFGITLGRWGVGPGPYLFLPVLGPSTVRDAVGKGADSAMNPLNYTRFPGRLSLDISSQLVGGLDLQVRSEGDLEALTVGADDPYATLRSVYLQSREAAIRGEGAAPILPPLDEPAPASAAQAAPSAQADPPPAPQAPRSAIKLATDDPDAPIATAQPCDRTAGVTALAMAD